MHYNCASSLKTRPSKKHKTGHNTEFEAVSPFCFKYDIKNKKKLGYKLFWDNVFGDTLFLRIKLSST